MILNQDLTSVIFLSKSKYQITSALEVKRWNVLQQMFTTSGSWLTVIEITRLSGVKSFVMNLRLNGSSVPSQVKCFHSLGVSYLPPCFSQVLMAFFVACQSLRQGVTKICFLHEWKASKQRRCFWLCLFTFEW